MKPVYIVIGVILLFCILVVLVRKIRTLYAVKKVKSRSDTQKLKDLNKILEPFGYFYEKAQDIFSTTLHPWQREMGYCSLYDESAISLGMVIHCEPIEFEYAGSLYLLEFWKGQYGMTVGAEIGIYKADKPKDYKKGDFVFYQSVNDEELLSMSMEVYQNGKPIMKRAQKHWWLTAFSLGTFASPEELAVAFHITFPNNVMRTAFLQGLFEAGYSEDNIQLNYRTITVFFKEPKAEQPIRKWKLLRKVTARRNRFFCKYYLRLTDSFERTLDRIDYLKYRYRILYFVLLHFGRMNKRKMARIKKRYKG